MNQKLLDYIDYDSCIALIPARGGSKSVPKKNICPLCGHPLIAYSIAASKLAGNIERVIVSTDYREIADAALYYGAEVPFLRPSQYSQDNSPDIDFVRHFIGWMAEQEGRIPEYIVHVRVTSPVRDYRVMEQAVERIKSDPKATALRSGHVSTHPPYKWLKFAENGYLEPLMPGMTCDETNLARQGFPQTFVPNGYVDILKADYVIKTDLMLGDRLMAFLTEETIDIDTEEDLRRVGMLLKEQRGFVELVNYLKKFTPWGG